MCDYSLEMYRSRPAVTGESYELTRFPSGSLGFVAPTDRHTAICMSCDSRLQLANLPADLRQQLGVSDVADVTFVRLEGIGPYHDGVRFANGTELTLQRLGPGVVAQMVDDLTAPVIPTAAKVPSVKETETVG